MYIPNSPNYIAQQEKMKQSYHQPTNIQSNGLGVWTSNMELAETTVPADYASPLGMGESLERLHRECCILQEQLVIMCGALTPILKPLSKDASCGVDRDPMDASIGVSERTALIYSITNKVWEMQRYVDLLYRSVDL